jgi:hypothetical protein
MPDIIDLSPNEPPKISAMLGGSYLRKRVMKTPWEILIVMVVLAIIGTVVKFFSFF